MKVWLVALMTLALPLLASAQDKKKNAELVVLEFHARRNVSTIQLDGRLKNVGGKTAEGVTVIFHFMAPGGATLTSQTGPLQVDDVGPDEEAVFLLETAFPPRTVRVKLELVDRNQREVKLQKSGPYPIE